MVDQSDFLLEEFRALREEILFHASHSRRLEISIVLGIGAVYGWSPRGGEEIFRTLIWWAPPLLAMLGAFREYGSKSRALQIAEYIRKIEVSFSDPWKQIGWEHFLFELREQNTNGFLGVSQWIYWLCLFGLTAAIAVVKTCTGFFGI